MKKILHHSFAALKMPFVRNFLTFQTTTMTSFACGLLSSIVYARLLGLNQFGFLAIIGAFSSLLSIVAYWGQDTALTTFLSEAIGTKDYRKITSITRYYAQVTIITFFLYIILIAIAPLLSLWTNGDASIGHHARLALLTNAFQAFPVITFLVLQLQQKIGVVATLENIRSILNVAISIILIRLGLGINGVLLGNTIVAGIYVILSLYLYQKYAPSLGLPRGIDILQTLFIFDTLGHLLQGLWIAFDRTIARNMYPNLFFVMLAQWAPRESVALFRVGLKLAQLPAEFINTSIARISAVSLPRIAAQDSNALRESVLKLIKGTMFIMLCAMTGALVFVPLLTPVIYGNNFTESIRIFLLILPFNICSALGIASVPLARVKKLVWAMTLINLIGIVDGIGFAWLLKQSLQATHAVSLGILVYHCHSLLLYPLLWFRFRRGGKRK